MKPAIAAEVSARLQNVYRELNEVLLVVEGESPGELKRVRDATSKVLLLILTELLNPLYAEHPELSPPDLRHFFGERKSPQKKPSSRTQRPRRAR